MKFLAIAVAMSAGLAWLICIVMIRCSVEWDDDHGFYCVVGGVET